jgi:carboxymethylenebutenolidase
MISTQWITVPNSAGSTTDAYLALPPGGKGPGLLLFQEIFGVNRHIRAVAEQYAQAGYVVLAPDMFWAQVKRVELSYVDADREAAFKYMQGCDQNALIADIKAYAGALSSRAESTSKLLGAVGYCMGGRMAYLAAAHVGAAASCYYGGGIQNNLQFAANITSPIQFHYGAKDKMIPSDAVNAVRAAVPSGEVFVYDADHGFNCWDRAMFDAQSARVAFARTLAFFAKAL